MKIDWYTKAVLTVIAIGVGFLVFEQKPVKEAQAFVGGGEMISAGSNPMAATHVFHLKGGKIRQCFGGETKTVCYGWSE
jgi:hypothetical protein